MEVSINYNELIIRGGLDKNKHKSINLYFQDESRFSLMIHIISSIDGDSFVYEIGGTTSEIFFTYIEQLSLHRMMN